MAIIAARFCALTTLPRSMLLHSPTSRFSYHSVQRYKSSATEWRTQQTAHRSIAPKPQSSESKGFNKMPLEKTILPQQDYEKLEPQKETQEELSEKHARLNRMIENIKEYNPLTAGLSEEEKARLAESIIVRSPDPCVPMRSKEFYEKEEKIFAILIAKAAKVPIKGPSSTDKT